jgi:hypothetical protein
MVDCCRALVPGTSTVMTEVPQDITRTIESLLFTAVKHSSFRSPRRLGRAISNHEETMGAVAPELLDKSKFPIEIGLHRVGIDLGTFIGTPIAM